LRPPRDTIAAPDLPDDLEWVGRGPRTMPLATARGPVLVHFFDIAQLNSVRTLPYVSEWARRYYDTSLTVLGVHSPRSALSTPADAVAFACGRLGLEFPVAIDAAHDLWHAYGCEGWPSLFLWGKGGALRWFQFGEGEYKATEEAIQEELRAADAETGLALPAPMEPIRSTDAPGVLVVPPSEEIFPGGSMEQPWLPQAPGDELEVAYTAGGAYASADGEGVLHVALDGDPAREVAINGPGLYELASHERHEGHTVVLTPGAEVRIWSVSFAAGLPPAQ
jgi:hypothetical protein